MSADNLLKSGNNASGVQLFGAYLCDDETTKQLVPVLNEREWDTSLVKTGGIESAIRTLSTIGSPQYLLVDLSNSAAPEDDINALAEVCEPGTMVIATGTVNDITFYRNMIACGVQDYLVKPVSTDQLREAFISAEHTLRAPVEGSTQEARGVRKGRGDQRTQEADADSTTEGRCRWRDGLCPRR